jgi:hypothetical protein
MNPMSILRSITVTTLLGTAGCTALPAVPFLGERIPVADAQHPVMDMSCIWQEGEGRTPEGFPCRGFCGQLMFIAAGSGKPAIVNGSVKIYVFDQMQTEPLNVYEFSAGEWATFARKTNLGMTYQLFIPYTRSGDHQAECSLRVCFTDSATGRPLWSQPTSIILPGKGPVSRKAPEPAPGAARTLESDAAFHALARKLQTDQAARNAGAPQPIDDTTLSLLRQRAAGPDPRIQKLNAMLRHADAHEVDTAAYEVQDGRPAGVSTADHTFEMSAP